MYQNNVMSLADFRAKRGLPEAFPDTRTPLERVVARYHKFDLCRDTSVKPIAALRVLASSCAKAIVAWAEQAGRPVDDAARFQFFAAGSLGQELLRVRVSRLGPVKGPWQAQEFDFDCNTFAAVPTDTRSEVFKPLLTLPMSGFYRLR